MAGGKGSAALKLGCEPEIVHIAGSVSFEVLVSQPESEQIPTSELNPTARANGKLMERHFAILLQACDTVFHGQFEWRQGVHVSGPLGHEIPALLQGVGCQV